jgi:signal transduction histidine kinase
MVSQLRSVGTAFLRQRPWVVAPGMIITIGSLIASSAPRRQVVVLSIGMCAMLAFFASEAIRARRADFDERYLLRSLIITLFGIAVASFATGGIRSPLAPFLFAPTVVAFAAFGRARASSTMFVLLGVAAVILALARSPFPAIVAPFDVVIAASAFVFAALLLRLGVGGLSDAYADASEAIVASAEARSRALESLGAKVAHEIKNPLASVRGLVELTREEAEGRARTRLDVVLRETERIEQILRDYLSFARPLTDVAIVDCDLRALCDELAAVMDGRARRAGVQLRVVGAGHAQADPARLKEALLNLLTNAIEAGSSNVSIELRDGEIRVVDDGRGLDLERVGTPGYTTKKDGTGLGVALARGVIAQHGGSLTFQSKQGTVAIVRLGREA